MNPTKMTKESVVQSVWSALYELGMIDTHWEEDSHDDGHAVAYAVRRLHADEQRLAAKSKE